ncbi:MAG: GNAT family N-acetyltransferase [Candidatus Kariarchaeaceae archaeon]|jgi:ribosomal protein S18 acetylase RimI-like enzyme
MIEQISVDQLDQLNQIITDCELYFLHEYDRKINFKEQFQRALSNGTREIFAVFNDNHQTIGFSVVAPQDHAIFLFFVSGAHNPNPSRDIKNIEEDLFTFSFDNLKAGSDYVRINPPISNNMKHHFVSKGIQTIKRARMSIDKNRVVSLADVDLKPSFAYNTWDVEYKSSVAEFLHTSHFTPDHDDSRVFPQFVGVEGCNRMIEEIISNKYGEFRKNSSTVLSYQGVSIGICFFTIMRNEIGYIPEIALNHKYKGRKCGKALLIRSLKNFFEKEPEYSRVELDVTLSNEAAFKLYKSIGFEKIRDYEMYIWNR